jgi:hypothetical protein
MVRTRRRRKSGGKVGHTIQHNPFVSFFTGRTNPGGGKSRKARRSSRKSRGGTTRARKKGGSSLTSQIAAMSESVKSSNKSTAQNAAVHDSSPKNSY